MTNPNTDPAVKATKLALIVEDDTLVGMGLKSYLERLGYTVVGQAADAPEATQLFRQHKLDLVLIDICLNGVDGLDLARQLLAERRVPMIVVSAYSEPALIERAGDAGVFGYLIKPVRFEALAAQVQVAMKRFEEQEKLRQENQQLAANLEARKVIERAKGIYMKRLNLSEADAHRRLQLESQRRRVNIVELAKKIIESEELLGNA